MVRNPLIWAWVTTEPGTSAEECRIFVEHVLDAYDVAENPALRPTLIHNNLTLQCAPEVYEAICERGHRAIYCPPYCPQDGPVEYAINQIYLNLTKRCSKVNDLEMMQTVIEEIIDNNITGINKTFLHCSYIWN